MTNVFITVVVPGGQVTALKNTLKNQEDHPGLDGMFTTGMSPTGNAPATHYVSSGYVSEVEWAALQATLPAQAMLNTSGETPWQTFSRLNLKIVNEEI